MEFIWDDGGRATAGFVGLAGDCVTRSIAIATGTNYRDVYQSLGRAAEKSPRNGVDTETAKRFLQQQGWSFQAAAMPPFASESLPKGVLIVHLINPDSRSGGHFCCVMDHQVHDTWNPCEDDTYVIAGFWTGASTPSDVSQRVGGSGQPSSRDSSRDDEQELTQTEFEKILSRLRALDSTASNHASTEGEKRNALRMMQNLMLRHNLSREDITEDDNVDSLRFTRMACPVNGRRACGWEKNLAAYLTKEMFPMTQWYHGTRGHRTLFWFYGPRDDVKNCLRLFREMLLTIATSAQLQYGGHTRGSGASYAEGYVRGLPRHETGTDSAEVVMSQNALIHARVLAVRQASTDWLRLECGISLVTSRGSGRDFRDPDAESRGKKHGSRHDLSSATGRKRIGRR